MTPSAYHARLADVGDSAVVRALDDLAFPPVSQDQRRPEPGELEVGVAAGDVFILEHEGVVVGYLHADRSRRERVYMSGVGVHPDFQGRGLGGLLIDHLLECLGHDRHRIPVITATSPRNIRMLRALFRRGFAARWLLRDHFGPGHDRFGCQLSATADWQRRGVWMSASHLEPVFELMSQGFIVRSVDGAWPSRTRFELIAPHPREFAEAGEHMFSVLLQEIPWT